MAEHDQTDPGDERTLDALAALAAGGPELEQPPEGVWDRIAEAAFAAEADHGTGDAAPAGADADLAAVPSLAERRRWRPDALRRVVGYAAVFVVAIGVGLGAAWLVYGGDGDDASTGRVASAELEPLEGVGEGQATVLDEADGARLQLDVQDLPPTEGFYEVWVASADLADMVSLGALRDDGTYELPDGFDPATQPVVDVSDEPLDGDPTHSTVSVLRGTLRA